MRKPNRIFILYILLAALYIGFSLTIPIDENALTRYGLTVAEARVMQLTVLIPYALIWFAAFWGSTRLKKYALMIERSSDGQALSQIADGLMIVAVSMPITALFSAAQSYAQKYYESAVPFVAISSRYVEIIIGLFAFGLIYKGAGRLLSLLKKRSRSIYEYVFIGLFLILGTSFTYLTLRAPYRQFPAPATGEAIYYLPDVLLLLTVIIPSLYIWYQGLSAAFAVQAYRQHVKGVLYRKTLGYVASGVLFVVTSRIILRFLTSISQTLDKASLKFMLVIIYLLLINIAAGFLLIAIGTRRLKKIEEV